MFQQALWIGDHLQHTLINPNQLQHFVIEVQDNPFSRQPMGIILPHGHHDGIHITLLSTGTIIHKVTCSCKEDDLTSLTHILLTSNQLWDPHNIQFPSGHPVEEEIAVVKSMKFHLAINVSKAQFITPACCQVTWLWP